MSDKSLWSGMVLPNLVFKPTSIPGALVEESVVRGKRKTQRGVAKSKALPNPPSAAPPGQELREVYYLNKQTFICQAGMPQELAAEFDTGGEGKRDLGGNAAGADASVWRKTHRTARVGYFGETVKDYDQYLNVKSGVVLYKVVRAEEDDIATKEPHDSNAEQVDEEEEERRKNTLVHIDARARFVFDRNLENNLKRAFMNLTASTKGGDYSETAQDVSDLCKNRQFLHASKSLRAIGEAIGIEIEPEGVFKESAAEGNEVDEEMIKVAASVALQGWWRGEKARASLKKEAISASLGLGSGETFLSPDVSVGGSKVWRVRDGAGRGGDDGVESGAAPRDAILAEPMEEAVSPDPAQLPAAEADDSCAGLELEVQEVVDAAFEELTKGKETLTQLATISTINTLVSERGSRRKKGMEATALDRLGEILPAEKSVEMDDFFRRCDESERFTKVLFRRLFLYTNSRRNKGRSSRSDSRPSSAFIRETACTKLEQQRDDHANFALSCRVSIARGWTLVAAGDMEGASRAASTAMKHIWKSSKIAGQTAYDIEALINLSDLIGSGLGDFETQGNILENCLKGYPEHPALLRSCGRLLIQVARGYRKKTTGFCQSARKFLERCTSVVDKAALAAGGKGFLIVERAEALYHLATFELEHTSPTCIGGEKSGSNTVPLVSIERKLRQALSLLAPILETEVSKKDCAANAMCSKLNFCLARLMHIYKGGQPAGSHAKESFNREEALRLYERAKWWGERSLAGKIFSREGYENCLAIGIHAACLLANMGKFVYADEKFRSVLYKKQHFVGVKSADAWLVYGAFLENCRGDLSGAGVAYQVAAKVAEEDRSASANESNIFMALSQLHELERGESEKGLDYLQKSLNCLAGKEGGDSAGVLVSAAQFASEVDGDVVTASQLLEKALENERGFGPALRWQGLLLARGGHIEEGLRKLKECCKWGGLSGNKIYTAGYRCLAMMDLASACDIKGEGGVWDRMSRAAVRARNIMGKVVTLEPNCRWSSMYAGLIQLSYFGNLQKAEHFLATATRERFNGAGEEKVLGKCPSDVLCEVIPAEAFRTMARLQDDKGNKLGAVGIWKKCLVYHPGDRLSMAGLATSLWGIMREGWKGGGIEGDLSGKGMDCLEDWKDAIRSSCRKLYAASVSSAGCENVSEDVESHNGLLLRCDGPCVPECHALYAAYLQDEERDNEGALDQLCKAAKAWKVAWECRDDHCEPSEGEEGKSQRKRDGLFVGSTSDVPSSVLYRLGVCAESRGDLAVAEKFYTWSMEVSVSGSWSYENFKHVMTWCARDRRRCKSSYLSCKRKRKIWIEKNANSIQHSGNKKSTPVNDDKIYELKLEEELAFTARSYMLHQRLSKLCALKSSMVENELLDCAESTGISTTLSGVVERGWESRGLCNVAGRDTWQFMM